MVAQESLIPFERSEDPRFLREQLVTYLGNKRQLLPQIREQVERVKSKLGKQKIAAADLFSGSGIVARTLKADSSRLVANDLEPYAEVVNQCYLTNSTRVDSRALEDCVVWLEKWIATNSAPGFIAELYAPQDDQEIAPNERVFFTRRNAVYLDTARRAIDLLDPAARPFVLGPLLSEASVHANTAGVFKGFYKNSKGVGQFGGDGRDALARIMGNIELKPPILSNFQCDVEVHRQDANVLGPKLQGLDLVYLDPPYNQHPYGSNYFMLNTLVEYKRPEMVSKVSGIPKSWNRSKYNQRRHAQESLFELVSQLDTSFVLLSYSSEGFVSYEETLTFLKSLGKVETTACQYQAFRGSRNLRARDPHVTEYLFLLEKS